MHYHEHHLQKTKTGSVHGSLCSLTFDSITSAEGLEDQRKVLKSELRSVKDDIKRLKVWLRHFGNLQSKCRELKSEQAWMINDVAEDLRDLPPPNALTAVALKAVEAALDRKLSLIALVYEGESILDAADLPLNSDLRNLDRPVAVHVVRSDCDPVSFSVQHGDWVKHFPSLFSAGVNQKVTLGDLVQNLRRASQLGFYGYGSKRFSFLSNPRLVRRARSCMSSVYQASIEEEAASKLTMESEEYRGLQAELSDIELQLEGNQVVYNRITKSIMDLHSYERELETDLKYLDRISYVKRVSELPMIEKRGRFYSLYLEGKPVLYRGSDGAYYQLNQTRKDRPLSIIKTSFTEDQNFRAERYAGLGMGDFCTHDGIPLQGEALKFASDVFSVVRSGVQVFPDSNIARFKQALESIRKKEAEAVETAPRTWGQEYLSSQSPKEIIPGVLFADTTQWKLYVFENCIVAEANHTNRGTYVGTLEARALFQSSSRRDILNRKPPELLDHFHHGGESERARQSWKNKLDAYIKS